jgi:hypothetical protein
LLPLPDSVLYDAQPEIHMNTDFRASLTVKSYKIL